MATTASEENRPRAGAETPTRGVCVQHTRAGPACTAGPGKPAGGLHGAPLQGGAHPSPRGEVDSHTRAPSGTAPGRPRPPLAGNPRGRSHPPTVSVNAPDSNAPSPPSSHRVGRPPLRSPLPASLHMHLLPARPPESSTPTPGPPLPFRPTAPSQSHSASPRPHSTSRRVRTRADESRLRVRGLGPTRSGSYVKHHTDGTPALLPGRANSGQVSFQARVWKQEGQHPNREQAPPHRRTGTVPQRERGRRGRQGSASPGELGVPHAERWPTAGHVHIQHATHRGHPGETQPSGPHHDQLCPALCPPTAHTPRAGIFSWQSHWRLSFKFHLKNVHLT